MARYGRRRFRRRPRRRRRRRGKVYKKGIPRKALSGRIDTAIEKRMVTLAKKEVKKLLIPLVYRQFFAWGDGDNNGPVSFDYSEKGVPVPLEGMKFEIQAIPLRTSTALGANEETNGTRATNVVKIYGVTIGLRVEFENFDQSTNAGYERNTLHWAVVGWRSRLNPYLPQDQIPAPINMNTGTAPIQQRIIMLQEHRAMTHDLLPLTPWGYTERLDNFFISAAGTPASPLPTNQYSKQGKYIWKKTFHRGRVSSKFQDEDTTPNIKRFSKFIRFKRPLTMKYVVDDGTGQTVLSPMKLFLVMRSEIPLNPGNNVTNLYLPSACGFYKIHYYDS